MLSVIKDRVLDWCPHTPHDGFHPDVNPEWKAKEGSSIGKSSPEKDRGYTYMSHTHNICSIVYI